MNLGISATKKKKTKMVGLQRGLPAAKKRNTGAHAGGVGVGGLHEDEDEAAGEDEGEGEQQEAATQKDPLRGKIREALPDEYLTRVMRW